MDFVIPINDSTRISISKDGLLTSQGLKEECPHCGQVDCYEHVADQSDPDTQWIHEDMESPEENQERQVANARVDGMESLILALVNEGYNPTDEKFRNAVIIACDAIANHS